MTTDQAADLKETLEDMFDLIEKKENVVAPLTRISQIQLEIADTAPPQLTHYLERRSYIKALEFLVHGLVTEPLDKPECEEDHP